MYALQKDILDCDDHDFDRLYSEQYRKHSSIHWTPIEIVFKALEWLNVKKESHVLDIGSGVGKFCSIGSLVSKGKFTGVEIRKDLILEAKIIDQKLGLNEVTYLHSDIKDVNFKNYDSFYYYNPFCEHISLKDSIDDSIRFSEEKYVEYEAYITLQLANLPIKTRVVTYYSPRFIFPESYELRGLLYEDNLALWIKTKE